MFKLFFAPLSKNEQFYICLNLPEISCSTWTWTIVIEIMDSYMLVTGYYITCVYKAQSFYIGRKKYIII